MASVTVKRTELPSYVAQDSVREPNLGLDCWRWDSSHFHGAARFAMLDGVGVRIHGLGEWILSARDCVGILT